MDSKVKVSKRTLLRPKCWAAVVTLSGCLQVQTELNRLQQCLQDSLHLLLCMQYPPNTWVFKSQRNAAFKVTKCAPSGNVPRRLFINASARNFGTIVN
eukprot:6221837-Amphidinium_carterae.1